LNYFAIQSSNLKLNPARLRSEKELSYSFTLGNSRKAVRTLATIFCPKEYENGFFFFRYFMYPSDTINR